MTKTILALTLVAACVAVANAQTKTIPGETKTVTATIEAIDHNARELTLKGEKGNYVTIVVSPDIKRFDELKVGDKITAKYQESLVLRVKAPGEKAAETASAGMTPGGGAKPGGTVATQQTVTVTITAIDLKTPSITFKGPHDWTYSSRVEDLDALKKVKVGDKVDITWTEALMIAVDTPAKKK